MPSRRSSPRKHLMKLLQKCKDPNIYICDLQRNNPIANGDCTAPGYNRCSNTSSKHGQARPDHKQPFAGIGGNDLLLHEHFHPISKRLKNPKRPSSVRTKPVLQKAATLRSAYVEYIAISKLMANMMVTSINFSITKSYIH